MTSNPAEIRFCNSILQLQQTWAVDNTIPPPPKIGKLSVITNTIPEKAWGIDDETLITAEVDGDVSSAPSSGHLIRGIFEGGTARMRLEIRWKCKKREERTRVLCGCFSTLHQLLRGFSIVPRPHVFCSHIRTINKVGWRNRSQWRVREPETKAVLIFYKKLPRPSVICKFVPFLWDWTSFSREGVTLMKTFILQRSNPVIGWLQEEVWADRTPSSTSYAHMRDTFEQIPYGLQGHPTIRRKITSSIPEYQKPIDQSVIKNTMKSKGPPPWIRSRSGNRRAASFGKIISNANSQKNTIPNKTHFTFTFCWLSIT